MEDSERLSLHQGRLGNLLAASDFRARQAGAQMITADCVSAAAAGSTA